LCCLLYDGENTPLQRVVRLHMPSPLVGICAELRINCERRGPDHTDGGKVSILQLSIVVRVEHRPNAVREVFNTSCVFSLSLYWNLSPPPCHGAFARPPIKASQSHCVVPITLRVSPLLAFGRERCFKCPALRAPLTQGNTMWQQANLHLEQMGVHGNESA